MYKEEQRKAAVELAAEIGVYAARKELGYPQTTQTLVKWCKDYGIDVALPSLAQRAAKDQLTTNAMIGALDTALEKAYVLMTQNDDLSADELLKLTKAIGEAVQYKRLLNDQSTANHAHALIGLDGPVAARILEAERANKALEEARPNPLDWLDANVIDTTGEELDVCEPEAAQPA